jgi:hypothetical protein
MWERELIRGSPVKAVEFPSSWARLGVHSECERGSWVGVAQLRPWSSLPAELGRSTFWMWERELIGTCHRQPRSIRHIFFWEDWSLILPRYWPAPLCFPWKFFLFYFYKKSFIFQSVESTWTINNLERVTVYLMQYRVVYYIVNCTGFELQHKSVCTNWEFLGKNNPDIRLLLDIQYPPKNLRRQ